MVPRQYDLQIPVQILRLLLAMVWHRYFLESPILLCISTGNVLQYTWLQLLTAETFLEEDLLATVLVELWLLIWKETTQYLCTDISTIKKIETGNRKDPTQPNSCCVS